MKHKAMFGRYQPWHKGHLWLLLELLKRKPETNVWIGVRDISPDMNNPYTPKRVVEMIKEGIAKALTPNEMDRVKITIIPDLEGVYYGRSVGYNVEELQPPELIAQVSATEIRNEKTDAIPAGPLADGVNLAEEGVHNRSGKHIQRDADSGKQSTVRGGRRHWLRR